MGRGNTVSLSSLCMVSAVGWLGARLRTWQLRLPRRDLGFGVEREQHRMCTKWKSHPFMIQPKKSAAVLHWLEQSQPPLRLFKDFIH